MRLKQIKLVGFKSFVDQTTVPFKSNLTAIVGPNGCGKSNIIDAVRWVMGESSAKHLRGESMSDVIFSGSDTRKPVGQASIELIFDNSDGTISGEYAGYNELAIKRLVTREGQSQYFLNGNHCRKKDITHIFLGTGLGPRSYAIIEQGIISRLIEAKPDELRVYIEEAAGVSKYKERRKETERRIRHTRDNLDRLNDIREELGRQLAHLQRQAKAAERYKTHKAEERQRKAELLALRWQDYNNQLEGYNAQLQDSEVHLSAAQADLQAVDTAIEKARVSSSELTDAFNEVQARYYGAGADIAGLEQTIKHNKERRQQLESDLSQLNQSERSALEHIAQDEKILAQVGAQIAAIEPTIEEQNTLVSAADEALNLAETSMHDWQQDWDSYQEESAKVNREVEVQQTQIQHAEMMVQRATNQLQKHQSDLAAIAETPDESGLHDHKQQLAQMKSELEQSVASVSQSREQLQGLRENRDQQQQQLQALQRELREFEGEHVKLTALQQASLTNNHDAMESWLDKYAAERSTLAESIAVDSGWQKAVETVLSSELNGVLINDSVLKPDEIIELQGAGRTLFIADKQRASGGLLDVIKANFPLPNWLADIKLADSLASALEQRTNLANYESMITAEGFWIGANWIRFAATDDTEEGILSREQRLRELSGELTTKRQEYEALESALQETRKQIIEVEQFWHAQQQSVSELNQQVAEISAEVTAKESKISADESRKNQLTEEIAAANEQISNEKSALASHRRSVETMIESMSEITSRKAELRDRQESLRTALSAARQDALTKRQSLQQSSMQLESLKIQQNTTATTQGRAEMQLSELGQRKEQLVAALAEDQTPTVELEADLQKALAKHQQIEKDLAEARQQLEQSEQAIRQLQAKRHSAEQHTQSARSKLENIRIETQTIKVRLSNEEEQLSQANKKAEDLLAELPEDASQEAWQELLEKIANRIQRLGAINLAAIEEYDTQSERKIYMDQQLSDLEEALETLENAIRKIDKETTTRFRETFENVNKGLQKLFPKVFGGGHAYLELTGDDLLSTGVSVMARPPGKRNSSISALSGGEKALTAIALVFAIFQMNPSPFCMLDEVDAPLDEANLGRFCRLVEEMAETVQFIYITHRKVTIEMAQHLSGVTMHEPGVSRMVSVDLDEATSLAESA